MRFKNYKKRDEDTQARKLNLSFSKIVFSLLGTLAVANVLIAVTTSTKGSEVISLEQQISELEAESNLLKSQIVKNSSLTTLSKREEELGMTKPENIIYLNRAEFIAQLP